MVQRLEVVQYKRTPMGKAMPPTAKTMGSTYSSIFCCWAYGPDIADAGMFLAINCRWVVKVVAVMMTTNAAVSTWTWTESAPVKLSEIFAPKISPLASERAADAVNSPMAVSFAAVRRTWKRAYSTGACRSSGRQEANGLVPVSL